MKEDIEYSEFKVRQKASRVLLPTLLLGLVAFAFVYFLPQIPVEFQDRFYWVIAAMLFLFWLLPFFSYWFSYLQLTNQRLIYRFGFLGLRRIDTDLGEVASIQIKKLGFLSGKAISIFLTNTEELVVSGYARTKLLATEIERLAKARG